MPQYADGIGQLHLPVAVVVRRQRLVGRERPARPIDFQSHDQLEDGDGVLQIDGLIGERGFGGGDGALEISL